MFKSGLFKSVIALLSGSAASQVLLLVTYFLIARWYGPESIGEIRNYTSIMLTGSLLVMGGYELALMLTNTERETAVHMRLCLRILGMAAVVLVPAGIILSSWIARVTQSPNLDFWAMLLPVSILAEGLINLLHQFLTKEQRYRQLSQSLLVYGVVFAAVALLGSRNQLSINWLFTALISAQLVKLAFYVFNYRKSRKALVEPIQVEEIKNQAKKYKDYPTYHLGSSVANYASREMVVPMLSGFYGSATAGLFSMANQILQLPMRFITQVVPQVFYQRIAKARAEGDEAVKKETLSAIGLLVVLAAVPTFLLALLGPWLFGLLLGEEWLASGEFVRWLALFAVVGSVVSPLGGLVNVHFKLRFFFFYCIALLISRLGAIALGYYLGSSVTSIALYSVVATVGAIVLFVLLMRLAGISLLPKRTR